MTLSFVMARGTDQLHIILHCSGFSLQPPSPSTGGRPRLVAIGDTAHITLVFPPQVLSEPAMESGVLFSPLLTRRSEAGRVQFSVPAGTSLELNAESVLEALNRAGVALVSRGTAGEETTVVEMPWRLFVSVMPRRTSGTVVSDHDPLPVTSPARVSGLWHLRLRATDGNAEDARLALLPLRNLHDAGVNTPLSNGDRQNILTFSRQGTLPDVRRFELTTLGGSLSVSAKWPSFEWDHELTLGRDQKIRILRTGVLYPFGHLAQLSTSTERIIQNLDQTGSPSVAGLVPHTVLTILDPVRYAVQDAQLAREFPFSEVHILQRTFNIDPLSDPWNYQVFVPKVGGQPLRFPIRCRGVGNDVAFDVPLVFVAGATTSGLDTAASAQWEPHSQIPLPGANSTCLRVRSLAKGTSSRFTRSRLWGPSMETASEPS